MRKIAIVSATTCLILAGAAGNGLTQHGIPTFDTTAFSRMVE